jgi:DNA polymerase
MKHFHMDFETFCALNIKDVGAYKYVQHPSAEPLMVSYCMNDDPVDLIDFTESGRHLSVLLRTYLRDPEVLIFAFNANFERLVLKYLFGIDLPPERFVDVMALVWALSFSGSLGQVGAQMGLPQDKQKDERGRKLIQRFCKPAPKNHKAGRYDHYSHPEEWEEFKRYCIQDTESERYIASLVSGYPMIEAERALWCLDARINDRGVPVDVDMVHAAIDIREQEKRRMMRELKEITGLDNPNSRDQMLGWFHEQGLQLPDLTKDTVEAQIKLMEAE